MRLNGKQTKQLREALQSAFHTRHSLEMLTLEELEKRLDDIAGGANHSEVVFNLILWAEAFGRLEELVEKAHQANPHNPALCRFVEEHFPALIVSATGVVAGTAAVQKVSPTPPAETAKVPVEPPSYETVPSLLGVQTSANLFVAPLISKEPVVIAPKPPTLEVNPMDGAELIRIPAGEFLMGVEKRKVILPEYAIYKVPVTVAMYRKYDVAIGKRFDWKKRRPDWGWQDDHPMVNLSWDQAKAYCDWAGVSLPTEKEWEKAARGTDGRDYPWGNGWDSSKCHCSEKSWEDAGSTAAVGDYPQGASPYDVLDMAGNVWEWCTDWYDAKQTSHVQRGGSWYFYDRSNFRCAFRYWGFPDRSFTCGFRCIAHSASA